VIKKVHINMYMSEISTFEVLSSSAVSWVDVSALMIKTVSLSVPKTLCTAGCICCNVFSHHSSCYRSFVAHEACGSEVISHATANQAMNSGKICQHAACLFEHCFSMLAKRRIALHSFAPSVNSPYNGVKAIP